MPDGNKVIYLLAGISWKSKETSCCEQLVQKQTRPLILLVLKWLSVSGTFVLGSASVMHIGPCICLKSPMLYS